MVGLKLSCDLTKFSYFFLNKFTTIKVKKAGNTHPKLFFAKGINCVIASKLIFGAAKPITSGILNKKVTNTTALNTIFDAYLSGNTFNKISTR